MAAELSKRSLPLYQVSSSNAESFVHCGASHILPQGDFWSEYQEGGTEGHEALGAFINGRMPNLTVRGARMVRKFPIGEILRDLLNCEAEVAYAVNVKTRRVRRIGKDIGRNYGELAPFEVPCTIDLEAQRIDGLPFVRDWKFGHTSNWWQVQVQCMAVAFPLDGADPPRRLAPEVDAGFVYIDGDTEGLEWQEDDRLVSLEEIDRACTELYEAFVRNQESAHDYVQHGIVPKTTEGPWCRYCRAYDHCPSKWELARNMYTDLAKSEELVRDMSPEQKGALYVRTQEMSRIIKNVQEAIKVNAGRKPVPLPDGKFLKMVDVAGRRSLDHDLVMATIDRLGGTEEDKKKVVKYGKGYQTPKEVKKP